MTYEYCDYCPYYLYIEEEYSDPYDDFFAIQFDHMVYCKACTANNKPNFIANGRIHNVKIPDWCPLKQGSLDTVLVHKNKIGDIVNFGPYKWEVLDVRYGSTLMVCTEKIEMENNGDLMDFLSNDFLQRFTAEEIKLIAEPHYFLRYNHVYSGLKFFIFEDINDVSLYDVEKRGRHSTVIMIDPANLSNSNGKTCTYYNGPFRPVVMIESFTKQAD